MDVINSGSRYRIPGGIGPYIEPHVRPIYHDEPLNEPYRGGRVSLLTDSGRRETPPTTDWAPRPHHWPGGTRLHTPNRDYDSLRLRNPLRREW
jgi:hypothetical protein